MYPQFITLPKNAKDITGQRFGRLTAIGPVGKNKKGVVWLCRCDCGNTVTPLTNHLASGNTKSCGCLQKEIAVRRNTTHGMTKHPIHQIWISIIQRCANPKDRSYANYGGRGIAICDEWRHNFKTFHDYVSQLSHCGEEGYTLDRINNSLGYSPGNLRFATRVEQNRNQRKNVMITHNGKTQCLAAWATELDVSRATLNARLRRGWSIERALTTPISVRV